MSDIIEVEHFSKRYGDFIAVDDISFTVEEGSIFAFLGPNGAGKSTTINTLCTILDKSEGNIYVAGHDVSKEKSLVRRDIGIVFQTSINNSSDILTDISSGYMKEVMVAPISRSQISMGHILSGAVIATLQGILTLVVGIALGLHMNLLQLLLSIVVMFAAAVTFSALGLFLATVSRNSPAFQTMSFMVTMPLVFVSGAFIPTTVMPGFLLPIVYLNPLTYTTSIFRYIALDAFGMSQAELVQQGMAFNIAGFVITPWMGLVITLLIGAVFFALCVVKFNKADFSTIKLARVGRGGGPR